MGITSRFRRDGNTATKETSSDEYDAGSGEKGYSTSAHPGTATHPHADANAEQHAHVEHMNDPTQRLHRGLKARQVTMIAIGGAM